MTHDAFGENSCCGNCVFARDAVSAGMTCHRFPPKVIGSVFAEAFKLCAEDGRSGSDKVGWRTFWEAQADASVWPTTTDDMFCGEWAPLSKTGGDV